MTKLMTSAALLAGLLAVAGCEPAAHTTSSGTTAKSDPTAAAKAGHDHSGWWCDEHGVPEDECSMCSSKVAKAAKAKGDWCDKHDRAKSICFICDPSLKDKYAAKYRAKFDKDPPPVDTEAIEAEKK